MISEMAAVEIVGPVEVFRDAVEMIQDAGALHIVETPLAEAGRAGLLEKMHLTDHQAEEREACARTAAVLDEMVADIPSTILKASSAAGLLVAMPDNRSAAWPRPLAVRKTPQCCDIRSRTGSASGARGSDRSASALGRLAACAAIMRPASAPQIAASNSELLARRLPPCSPVQATSPAA